MHHLWKYHHHLNVTISHGVIKSDITHSIASAISTTCTWDWARWAINQTKWQSKLKINDNLWGTGGLGYGCLTKYCLALHWRMHEARSKIPLIFPQRYRSLAIVYISLWMYLWADSYVEDVISGTQAESFFSECHVIFSIWSGVWVWTLCLSVNTHINGLKCLTFYHDHSLFVPTLLTPGRKFICIRYCVGQCFSNRTGPVRLQGKKYDAPFLWKWTLMILWKQFPGLQVEFLRTRVLFSYQSLLIKLFTVVIFSK